MALNLCGLCSLVTICCTLLNFRKTSNFPGVETRVPDFGNSTSVEWIDPSKASAGNYFATIAAAITKVNELSC